ncbi:MAG TPA: Calx-beta domain-containing protein [Polyangiaceae bacterium]|nr:Calx-beta domain-containing protein [Polyangiaceae bacterium]
MQDTRGSLVRTWLFTVFLFLSACTQVLGDFGVKPGGAQGPTTDGGLDAGGALPQQGPIIVTPTSGLVTSEAGRTAQFTIVLRSKPSANVAVALRSSNAKEGTINRGSVTFSKDNWSAPQTVTVAGVDDNDTDGNKPYTIITSPASSSDDLFRNVDPADITVTNVDDESAGFTISPDKGLVTSESEGEATFTVVLNTAPKADVTINLSSSDIKEGTVAPLTMKFTPLNWRSPQIATVVGQDDLLPDGAKAYKIITAPAISPGDLNYDKVDPDDVDVINEDNDTAGFTIKPLTGLITNENGQMATFTMALNFAPVANVIIRLSSSNTSEGIVSPTTLTFTTANWKAPQVVTVSGVNDNAVDGDQPFDVVTAPGESGDPAYNKLDPPDVVALNVDNDSPGITVKPAEGLITTEARGEATFTIVLNSKPSDSVTIGLSSSVPTEGAVSPTSVAFTNTNWNAPQTVTVTGMDDQIADGNQPYVIRTAKAVSNDRSYNDLDGPDVKVSNSDDDSAGFVVMPTMGLLTAEKGDFATFTIALTSKPTSLVTIALTSTNAGEGVVSPMIVTFTGENYRALQTVTVTGVDDKTEDGNQVYRIATSIAQSMDKGYDGLPVPDVELTNTDDDSAGITVKALETPLETSEKGDTAAFTVVLNSQPAPMTTVTIPLSSTNEAEGTLSHRSLVFTTVDWNAPRTVTITGVDDDQVQDGNQEYRVAIAAAASTDPKYNGIDVPDLVVFNVDNDVAGIKVTALAMLTTSEKGGTASFTIELNSKPTDPVTIALLSSLPTEGTVNPAMLVFSRTDWNAPQTVTVRGVDDRFADGNQPYAILTQPATSMDGHYDGINAADVALTNVDDDSPGFIITPTTMLTTNEDGLSASFTVQLQSEPRNDVTVALRSSDTGEGRTDVGSLVFTAANYNAPHTVTVTGVNDDVADRDQTYRIILDPATSTDGNYAGRNPIDVTVVNVDNDSPGFTVSAAAGTTRENGTTTTFTVQLTSQPAGTATVTIPLSSSNASEGVIMQPSLVFTTANWGAPQTVTVRGVDDDVADGNQQFHAQLGVAVSADPNYNGVDPVDVVITNVDNDKAGITVSKAAGDTTERGGATTFTVVLESQPTADVSIGITSSNSNEGVAMQPSLTFTTVNWAAPQTVTVHGVDDFVADSNQPYKVLLAPATGGDYAGLDPDDVDLINIDDDSPGFIVTPTSGLVTSENGTTTAIFTVNLTSQPLANVTVGVHSNDVTEGAASIALLTFTPLNYASAQTVTIRGVNDDVADGNQTYRIILDPAMSTDPNYNNRDPEDVTVSNSDNDTAAISVTPITGLITSENLATATFTVVLASQPTDDVTVPILSSNVAEGTVSPSSITFTASNWGSPVTVTVRGVDDPIPVQDGNRPYVVRVGPVTASADPKYIGLSGPDVNVTNIDNDSAGIGVSPTSPLVTGENQATATFTVVLTSQPSDDVVIPITSSDTAEGTVSPSSMTFTASNWSSPQTVTVRGVDDPVPTQDGNRSYVVHVGPVTTSADRNYVGKFANLSATNVDDDSAGITVTPVSGLQTGENGDTATFTVVLRSLPSGDVNVPIASSDTNEGTVTPTLLTFTTSNWSSPKTVTVRGVNDPIPVRDGNHPYVVHIGPVAMSADPNYVGAAGQDVAVVNIDDDSAGISVSATAISTNEDGTAANFTLALTSQPSGDVIIPISSSNTQEGTVSPSSVTFTASNWSSPRTVTVTGVDDAVPVRDGNRPYTVHMGPVVMSGDRNYVDKFADVTAINVDNDSAGIAVSAAPGLSTGENLATATFTVALTTQPSGNVLVPISSSNTAEGTVSPTVVTFTPMNWSSPRTITVTGVNDPIQDGDKGYTARIGPIVDSEDSNYKGIAASDVSLVNVDDDSAGITVSISAGLTTSEDATSASFTVVLRSQPATGTVTVPITSSNTGEGTITSVTPLVFDANNWSSPQTVTVRGVNDAIPEQDGDKPYVIHVGPVATSGDPNYIAKFADVGATNLDNDSAGFTLTPTPPLPLATKEDGTTAHFTIVLKTQPSGAVTIPVASLLTTEGAVSPGSVAFDASNWSTPQTVTVQGVDDNPPMKDGDKPYVVRVGPITTSADPNYVGVPLQDLNLVNVDNDSAGITVTAAPGLQTTENGGTATFTVVLTSVPSGGTVTVPFTSSDPGEAGHPASAVFDVTNWNIPQTVTITGLNDNPPVQDGNATYTISVGPSTATADSNYVGLTGAPVSVTNIDNDQAAILVSTSTITTSESGGTGSTFTVVLATVPAGSVTVPLSAPPPGEGTMTVAVGGMSASTPLVFAPGDWSTPRTVTIIGVDDPVPTVDGDAVYTLQFGPVTTSADSNYLNKTASVQVTNTDNDAAGLDIVSVPAVCTTTALTGVAFSVKLRTQPSADVTVNLSVNDLTRGAVTPSSLLFAPAQWNVPQMFDVNGGLTVGDYMVVADPDSADANYSAITSWGGTCTNGL